MKVRSSLSFSISPLLAVSLYKLDAVAPFSIRDSARGITRAVAPSKPGAPSSCMRKLVITKALETDDDYDDYDNFYNDFDPSDYEDLNQDILNSNSNEYTRDIDADDSDVDLEKVTELISTRSEMKKTRQYDEADRIRDELLENYGILVRDKDRKWRTGCLQNKNYSKWLHGDSLKPRGNFKRRDDFGPNGHDYVLARDAGPNTSSLSEEKIHELLSKRLCCKFDRDYDGADAIQAELLSAGVVIDGKAREWRADGKFFTRFAPREYNMFPHDYDISNDLEEIEKLILERSFCRAERLFKRSDELRDDLLRRFDVRVNDKMQLWSVGGQQSWGQTYRPYTMSDRSKVPSDVDEIETLVRQRDEARGNKDFVRADTIRNELLDKSIIVDDKKRMWYVGKVTKAPSRNVLNTRDQVPYVRRGGGDLTAVNLNTIQGLLEERNGHKLNKQYKEADEIRYTLLNKYGIQVDDKNREWYIVSNDYSIAHDSAEIDDETRSTVEQKIKDRILARGERNYDKADTIKKMLYKKYKVSIDDRVKEWTVVEINN